MPFVGFSPEAVERIKSWQLPEVVLDDFEDMIKGKFTDRSPLELPLSDIGMNLVLVIHDRSIPKRYFSFFVRFARNDMDFWISDCDCTMLERNKIKWSSTQDDGAFDA